MHGIRTHGRKNNRDLGSFSQDWALRQGHPRRDAARLLSQYNRVFVERSLARRGRTSSAPLIQPRSARPWTDCGSPLRGFRTDMSSCGVVSHDSEKSCLQGRLERFYSTCTSAASFLLQGSDFWHSEACMFTSSVLGFQKKKGGRAWEEGCAATSLPRRSETLLLRPPPLRVSSSCSVHARNILRRS